MIKKQVMKKIKWKIVAFVAWVVITIMVVDVGIRGVGKADTTTNIVSVSEHSMRSH